MRHAALVLATAALALSACAERRKVIVNNGIPVYERYWTAAVQSLSGRAQIELGCAQPELTYSLISRHKKVPTQIMVEGCDQRALYSRSAHYPEAWTRLGVPAPSAAPALNVNTNVNVTIHQPPAQ